MGARDGRGGGGMREDGARSTKIMVDVKFKLRSHPQLSSSISTPRSTIRYINR